MGHRTTNCTMIVLISFLAFFMTSTVYAQDDTPEQSYVKDGTYIGVFWVKNQMSGDFDATTYYTAPGELLDVPDVDDGTGFGIVLGGRKDKVAFEFGYQRSRHDTCSYFIDMGENEASYNVIDMNIKIDVIAKNKFRPYVLLGLGIPWLTVEDRGKIDGTSYEDATFFGLALNAGAGAAYYFQPQWAVTGGVIYRWNRFSSAEGKSLDDALVEKALCFNIGIAYTF